MRIYFFTIIFSLMFVSCADRTEYQPYALNQDFKVEAMTPIDYQFVRLYVLSTCNKCHAERVSPNLMTYQGVVDNIEEVVEEIHGGEMPPRADGYAALSACQKEVLDFWINEGMPEADGPAMVISASCF